ncbi:MAG: dUTP diphosphatase [Pseudomonadota bacterium]
MRDSPLCVSIQRLHPQALIPGQASYGAAGYDLATVTGLSLAGGQSVKVPCGIAIALPPGFAGLICPRSGLAHKHGVTVLNAPGVIDSDYRGEIGVLLYNTRGEPYEITPGQRIAQLCLVPIVRATWDLTEHLPTTERGEGGFGSTDP